MKRRSFTALKKELGANGILEFAKELAKDYAQSEFDKARKYFCEEYNVTQTCYYKLLELAVVESLVDDVTVVNIMHKSANNQATYYEGSGATSVSKYTRLYDKRCQLIAHRLPGQIVSNIANAFASGRRGTSKFRLACDNGIPTRAVDYVLEDAILENLVCNSVKEDIAKRLLKLAKKDEKEAMKRYLKSLGF